MSLVEKDDAPDDDVLKESSQLMVDRGTADCLWRFEKLEEEELLFEQGELERASLRVELIFNDASEENELSSSQLGATLSSTSDLFATLCFSTPIEESPTL
eukprot:CAMPEP_0204620096 /NCGR_PEP_ID=MMETSP0717-20131115/6235_1 /ASSEMBLY_ACC=CAM_ASM_000666 /TAXON_ID=230516 /ORGANISM="Chaetoceros curvisetus" /LENGTH=100 /DNA_ID=CAMNT_0051634201 /DNA_START=150 /DNA_END=455 /DNA_ORIENTATION=-